LKVNGSSTAIGQGLPGWKLNLQPAETTFQQAVKDMSISLELSIQPGVCLSSQKLCLLYNSYIADHF